ncbi:MAG TPA: UDP-N-acetylmuramoyl-tripeptide--D-alanyl-D-alanine ligase [Desulfomonilaceae bacterium]|nr:UDP-N-acetylmuramoyl-tripeptide--D-alanyl-D-alanine ligase [Desulfomonilaceae bacterium]
MRATSGPYIARVVAEACGGVILCGDYGAAFDAISTDSRDIKAGDLFVPLKGTNFDGHKFLFPALEAGARGSLINRDTHRDIHRDLTKSVLIQVQDTLLALSDLASAHRMRYPVPLIAVTGSSGKTTVKEMIAAVLARSHRPLISEGNFNNLIGLPMTVLNLGPKHTAAVVEAGINTPGEMDSLARAALPDVAVITTVGPVHLEGLGSIENVAAEKFKITAGLKPGGTVVVPAGNPYLEPLVRACPFRVITFGQERGDFSARNIVYGEQTSFEMRCPTGTHEMHLPVPGRHNVANALAAATAAWAIGIPLKEIAETLSGFVPPAWRMEMLPLPKDRVLIRDCYNANPQSVRAALEVLASRVRGSRTLAILADMMELGDSSANLHRQIGKDAAELNVNHVIFVGQFGTFFAEGYLSAGGDAGSVTLVPDKEAAWDAIASHVESYGTILVKGSRLMKMETLANLILGEN